MAPVLPKGERQLAITPGRGRHLGEITAMDRRLRRLAALAAAGSLLVTVAGSALAASPA